MRSVLSGVVVGLLFGVVSAAQTYKLRAPAFERLVSERLRIGPYASARDRALVFPCKPAGRGCASNPLDANKLVFEGPADAWTGFEICLRMPAGDVCTPVVEFFGAPPR